MSRRSGTLSRRITSSDVWYGTPLFANTGGTEGRDPAATTTRSPLTSTGSPPSVGATESVRSPVKVAWPR